MQPAQKPSARHFVLDVIDAFPGGRPAGAVRHPQEDTGDELDGERENQRASPDVTPTRAAGNALVERLVQDLADARSRIEPFDQFHVSTSFLAMPTLKFSYKTQTSSLPASPLISYVNVSSGRGLGLG